MDPVRIGIIGIGQIGKHHLGNYEKIPGAKVVAVADVNETELQRVATQKNIEYTTTNFRQLLKRDDIDAVDVCLHNNFHMPITVAALKAGKHVFCEKPMAGSYADALKMMRTATTCQRHLSIQLSTLFAKETKVAKRLIDGGQLGNLYLARSSGFRRRGRPYVDGYGTASFVQKDVAAGGALYDMGVYHIAQMLFLLGNPEVERINGKVYQEVGMDAARRKKSGFNVEELGMGMVRFKNDVVLDIIEAWAIHLNSFEGSFIVGSKGGIRLTPFSYHSALNDVEMDSSFLVDGADWRWHQLNADENAYDSPQHHWIAALQGRVKLLPTAELALATMLISEGIYLSNKLNREVSVRDVLTASKSTAVKL